MDERLYSDFPVKEIICDGGGAGMRDTEKSVIGEISLKIYINGVEYASLLCLNQLVEELALGFLYSEGVIDTIGDVASIAYNERLFAVIRLGVPVLVSRSTPTAAAVNLARNYNVTLLGYVRGNAGYVYSGEERLA